MNVTLKNQNQNESFVEILIDRCGFVKMSVQVH